MKQYRPNAAVVLFRQDGKVLLCERVEDYPKRWQFPQGGIDAGETPLEAAVRELREETSVVSAKLIYVFPEPLQYDFPPEVKNRHPERHNDGQVQYWHLFLFTGDEREINLCTEVPEFRSYQWIDIEEAPKRVVEFKKEIYEKISAAFKQVINQNIK